jgi:hypothetical protein
VFHPLFKPKKSTLPRTTTKEWVTTIQKDLKELSWDVNIDEIKQKRKTTFMRMLNKSTEKSI